VNKDKEVTKTGFLDRFLWIIVYIFGITIILPILVGVLAGQPAGSMVGFLFSCFALQAIAAPIGLRVGLTPLETVLFMAFFGIGLILGVFEMVQTLGTSSKKVASFIDKIKQKTSKYPFITKYGSVTCFLIVWIPGIGLYGTPVIAWLLSWKRVPSTIFTFLGFMSGCFTFLFLAGVI
jgi:uncharacterized membrane protein